MTPTPLSTTLHCATLIVLALSFVSTSLGIGYVGEGWGQNVAIGSGALLAIWGAWLAIGEVRRLVRRYRLQDRFRPLLIDRARYLSGHPAWPQPRPLSVLLTADALLLDDDRETVRLPLAALRQSLPSDLQDGRRWMVAHNEYRTPSDSAPRLVVEFLDGGFPRRIALTNFRRTRPDDWTAALQAACLSIVR